ncbi:MAG: ECF-type sigma factor [Acidobacteriota bacterium]
MGPDTPQDITALVQAWSRGEQVALERLIPLVDAELRRIARRHVERRRPDVSLQTTSLLNEAYVRLLGVKPGCLRDRVHFFALCASIIRGILVDHARARGAAKRGGGLAPVSLKETAVALRERSSDLVAVDEALTRLTEMDPRRGRVVELRFFGGLTVDETAEFMGISPETVKRDWRVAKLWLMKELAQAAPFTAPGSSPPAR